jgi:hypothetical protein
LFAEGAGELFAKLLVLLREAPDAGVGSFESPQQGSIGGALACGDGRCGVAAFPVAAVTRARGPSDFSTSSMAALTEAIQSGWKRFSPSPRSRTKTASWRSSVGMRAFAERAQLHG